MGHMTRSLPLLLLLCSTVAVAGPKKYHFELTAVTPKSQVSADMAKAAVPRVEAQVKKAFATHPQLVPTLEGAPDTKDREAYRKYLTAKGISGAYLVTVEVTEASEELVPMEDKKNAQRLSVHIAIHMLGERIPDRTMGFTGDGQATIKIELGKVVRDKDRQYAWDQAAEIAITDAMKTAFKQLAVPPKKQ